MEVVEPVETMQLICERLAGESREIRLIPTMGSLHVGHASLIKRANKDTDSQVGGDHGEPLPRDLSDSANVVSGSHDDSRSHDAPNEHDNRPRRPVIVVSIFVNPLQFNEPDDFIKYPISIEQDLALCERLKVDYVFMPKCQELLGDSLSGRKTSVTSKSKQSSEQISRSNYITLKPPAELAEDLEGKSRPNHFEGMLTIVCKMFNIVRPTRAYFGKKDYQQLVLVDKMVKDLNMTVRICPVDTVRETTSNLPLSSRNSRLSDEQKQKAADLMFRSLVDGKQCLESRCRRSQYDDSNANELPGFDLDTILLGVLLASQSCWSTAADEDAIHVDYFEVRCAKDLSVIEFDRTLNLYDCRKGCIKARLDACLDRDSQQSANILKARLLMSIVIAQVRLLDNMSVQLNL